MSNLVQDQDRQLAAVAKALGHPVRALILRVLVSYGELSVTTLTTRVGASQPEVSRHLRILREAELVTVRREGRRGHYEASRATLRRMSGLLGALAMRAR
jgi:ArsR family transcriptional regulator